MKGLQAVCQKLARMGTLHKIERAALVWSMEQGAIQVNDDQDTPRKGVRDRGNVGPPQIRSTDTWNTS